jgi:hypothetical protein
MSLPLKATQLKIPFMIRYVLILSGFLTLPVFAAGYDPNQRLDANTLSESALFPRKIETGPRAWAIACCAILVQRNFGWHDTLPTCPLQLADAKNERRILKRWWDITDHDSLIENLSSLRHSGMRAHFERVGRAVSRLSFIQYEWVLAHIQDPEKLQELIIARTWYDKLGPKSLLGWDYSLAIFLCRSGYTCGYISDEEAERWMMSFAKRLQETFDSWEDLANNYVIGYHFWCYKYTLENNLEINNALDTLLEMPTSPWNTLPWKMDLTTHD